MNRHSIRRLNHFHLRTAVDSWCINLFMIVFDLKLVSYAVGFYVNLIAVGSLKIDLLDLLISFFWGLARGHGSREFIAGHT